jgi:hypothetical protein
MKKYFFEVTAKDSETLEPVASTTTSSEYSYSDLIHNPHHAIKGVKNSMDVLLYAFSENLWRDQKKDKNVS